MYMKQLGLCTLCFKPMDDNMTKVHVEHDHATGKIRGLVHPKCNRLLGHIESNPTLLSLIPKYLGWT